MLNLSKTQSTFAKGIAILMMIVHHLFAFPDRLNFVFTNPYLIQIGQDFGIVVGLFVFLNGYGQTATAKKLANLKWGGEKLINVYIGFWKVAIPFLLTGFFLGHIEYNTFKLIKNLSFWKASYNHEWWYMYMYVQFLLISFVIYRIQNKYTLSTISIVTALIAIYAQQRYGIPFPGKLKHIGALLHYWPTYVLAMNVYLWNLFERVEGGVSKVIHIKIFRIILYITLAIVIHYYAPTEWKFLQFFFYYLVICFTNPNNFVGIVICFFGKHSMNIWLLHTFICYYYWQDWLLYISLHKWWLTFINLTIISLLCSLALNTFYDFIGKLYVKIKKINDGM